MESRSVVSTHVTFVHRPGRLVVEIEPGIFVIENGSVKSADVAGGLFLEQADSEHRPFVVTPRQLKRVREIAASRELNP